MPSSLPAEIQELMSVSTVLYERATGTDGYAQTTYAPAIEITCWMEGHGLLGGTEAYRASIQGTATVSTEEPQYDLYFNGDNPNVRAFSTDDQFTLPGVPPGNPLKPRHINTAFGPPFDNRNPWLVVVSL